MIKINKSIKKQVIKPAFFRNCLNIFSKNTNSAYLVGVILLIVPGVSVSVYAASSIVRLKVIL